MEEEKEGAQAIDDIKSKLKIVIPSESKILEGYEISRNYLVSDSSRKCNEHVLEALELAVGKGKLLGLIKFGDELTHGIELLDIDNP